MTRPASNGSIIGATQEPTPTSAGGIWTLPAQLELQKQGKWIAPGYNISRSLRFDSARSNYLSRTPSSTGNRRTFTFSSWVKLSSTSTDPFLMGAGANGQIWIYLNKFRVRLNGSPDYYYDTAANIRDFSAWYHFVVAVDTTDATSAERVKIYINGTRQTIGASTAPPQNWDTDFNLSSTAHTIGNYPGGGQLLNGYMTEIHFIDGQALDPSYFGVTDTLTGVWRPKQVENMNYGTNGFYLPFSDNTSTTTLGYDQSGNANNWTLSAGFSVAAGANNDSLVDTPTPYGTDTGAGGEVRGNYCTFSPLDTSVGTKTITNGNLDTANNGNGSTFGNFGMSSGKWYFELTLNSIVGSTSSTILGITASTANKSSTNPQNETPSVGYVSDGNKIVDGSATAYGATYTTNDVIGVAVDIDSGSVTFYKNGASQGAISKTLAGQGTGFYLLYTVAAAGAATNSWTLNAGQRPFAYTAPSGFKALVTTNLPDPTILQGDDHFNTVLYTGDATSGRAITGVGFEPSFVWFKSRNVAYSHVLVDAVRGGNKVLYSETTDSETTATAISSFDADGMTINAIGSSGNSVNASGSNTVAWNWKANGAGSSNTDGSITSTVSANTTAGISIVTYTGTGSLATVGHGLGVKPAFILTKSRSTTEGWGGYHKSLGASYGIFLELTDAAYAASNYWNNTEPTSTVFTVNVNRTNNGTMVAYCFAEVEGFSKFGSYTGNGSADGPFVYTGFRPAWLLIKRTDAIDEWELLDAKRSPENIVTRHLHPNRSNAEATNNWLDFTSNGFKIRDTNSGVNTSSGTYIYACFAEFPFRNALAR